MANFRRGKKKNGIQQREKVKPRATKMNPFPRTTDHKPERAVDISSAKASSNNIIVRLFSAFMKRTGMLNTFLLLMAALVGAGIPAYYFFKDVPKFKFRPEEHLQAQLDTSGNQWGLIYLHGAILNEGKRPLNFEGLKLVLSKDGESHEFEAAYMSRMQYSKWFKEYSYNFDTSKIKDLNLITRLEAESNVEGGLLFINKENLIIEFMDQPGVEGTLIAVDRDHDEWKSKFVMNKGRKIPSDYFNPKTGLSRDKTK